MTSWICNGIPKNGKAYPNASGEHEDYENYGPDCVVCGLPKEAMDSSTQPQTTRFMGGNSGTSSFPLPIIIGTVVLFLIIGGVGVFFLIGNSSEKTDNNNNGDTPITNPNTKPSTSGLISDNASNSDKISQGEKILLDSNQDKDTAAASFAQQDWQKAKTEYESTSQNTPNDPEGKIYFQNALAREAGNPLTIAAVVPISASPDSAAEILRGVARYQEEFNQSPLDGKLLEVVIVDNSDALIASSLADDLINSGNILGVLGYGVDPGSQKAVRKFNDAGMAVLSPLTTSLDKSVLQTIPVDQKSGQLLTNYLQAVSKTLTEFAKSQNASVKAVIYYNSDSPYSMQLKQELTNSLTKINGQMVQEIDIVNGGDFAKDLENAQQKGANTVFLALSKSKVADAIKIAQGNSNLSSPLNIFGGDELYNADILVQGGDAIANLILAVPWSFNPNDPFAKDAVQSWKGRVSWRTATAYDATKALGEAIRQDPTRSGTTKLLNQGITLKNSTTDFNIFNEVPLVKAVKGQNGPPGSSYQFDSIK
jgi:ABC-type branched-subunit amino acid transport system substrate-binding protein